jgi:hypothetical protein
MNTTPAKLASTACGMDFEKWMRRPVYRAQCFTFSIARELCNIKLKPGEGLATVYGESDTQGLNLFRCLQPYRSAQAKQLRNRVAAHVREMRRKTALMC